MTGARRDELEMIVDLALAKMDIAVTKEQHAARVETTREIRAVRDELRDDIHAVRDEMRSIPPMIDYKIQMYDDRQRGRRRWNIRTLIGVTGLALTALIFVLTHL